MEPFEKDELTDSELQGLLRSWEVPDAPAKLREAVFGRSRGTPWWAVWGASIRVPVPLIALVVLVLAVALWQWPRRVIVRQSPSRVEVKTVRVEVPVVKKEVVTRIVYRDRKPGQADPGQANPSQANEAGEWRRVTELHPRIIRSQQ